MPQRYVSSELTHFVGRRLKSEEEQYQLLKDILCDLELRHPSSLNRRVASQTVSPNRRVSSNERYGGTYVCFCDIPVADLSLHMAKYSRFGLALRKAFLVPLGASPVFYVAKSARPASWPSGTRADWYDKMVDDVAKLFYHLRSQSQKDRHPDPLLPGNFLDFDVFSLLKFFDPDLPEDHPCNYYMEREWRVIGSVPFGLSDVRRIILPEAYALCLRADLPEYTGQVSYAE